MNYDNTNTGALFPNDKRESDKHPQMKGSIDVDGVEYWVSAWTNVSKAGTKYQSLKLSRKDQQLAPKTVQPAPSIDLDDDLPF